MLQLEELTSAVVQGLLIYEQTRIEIDPDESPHSIRCVQ